MSDRSTSVTDAVESRRSIRAFLSTPVDGELIRHIVRTAARAPSGGNLQPWHIHVVGGDSLDELKAIMRRRVEDAPQGEPTEYDVYPPKLHSPYRERRFQVGEDMYRLIGIPREDKAARRRWFARNFQFFGAPLALFCYVDRRMGPPQWSDLGMYLQTVMLLLREAGLHSCAQECWSLYPETIGGFLRAPEDHMLFTGMSIGYPDLRDPVTRLRARRAPLEEFARFHGI